MEVHGSSPSLKWSLDPLLKGLELLVGRLKLEDGVRSVPYFCHSFHFGLLGWLTGWARRIGIQKKRAECAKA